MPDIKIKYDGNLRTTATHLKSGSVITTDAPVDNKGKGENFSPTDLFATALGSCMLTIMGIIAKRDGIMIEGTTADVEKIMVSNPRRIGEIRLKINFPHLISGKDQVKLERAAHTCPVSGSIHNDLNEIIEFIYPNS